MGIKSWRLQIRQGSGPPLPTSSVSCFAKRRNPRKKSGQELSNISARFKPESPGRCWFLRGGRCLTEVRTGAGRPHVRSGFYCPNQTGEPRTPAAARAPTAGCPTRVSGDKATQGASLSWVRWLIPLTSGKSNRTIFHNILLIQIFLGNKIFVSL